MYFHVIGKPKIQRQDTFAWWLGTIRNGSSHNYVITGIDEIVCLAALGENRNWYEITEEKYALQKRSDKPENYSIDPDREPKMSLVGKNGEGIIENKNLGNCLMVLINNPGKYDITWSNFDDLDLIRKHFGLKEPVDYPLEERKVNDNKQAAAGLDVLTWSIIIAGIILVIPLLYWIVKNIKKSSSTIENNRPNLWQKFKSSVSGITKKKKKLTKEELQELQLRLTIRDLKMRRIYWILGGFGLITLTFFEIPESRNWMFEKAGFSEKKEIVSETKDQEDITETVYIDFDDNGFVDTFYVVENYTLIAKINEQEYKTGAINMPFDTLDNKQIKIQNLIPSLLFNFIKDSRGNTILFMVEKDDFSGPTYQIFAMHDGAFQIIHSQEKREIIEVINSDSMKNTQFVYQTLQYEPGSINGYNFVEFPVYEVYELKDKDVNLNIDASLKYNSEHIENYTEYLQMSRPVLGGKGNYKSWKLMDLDTIKANN